MKAIVICGLGGGGREIYDLVGRVNDKRWDSIIFCDKEVKSKTVSKKFMECDVFSFEQIINKFSWEEVEFVISVGDVYLREKIYNRIRSYGFRLATLIAPNVCVPKSTIISDGVIIRDNCYISVNVTVQSNSMIQPNTVIGHDVKIGCHSIISAQSALAGASVVGEKTYIALGVVVKEGTVIGNETIVSMGTVVNKNVSSGLIVRGNPVEIVSRNVLKSAFRLHVRDNNE